MLLAWPRDSILRNFKRGDSFATPVVATTTTTSDGRFQLAVDPSSPALANAIQPDGSVNFAVVGRGAGAQGSFSFSRKLAGGTWRASNGSAWDTAAVPVRMQSSNSGSLSKTASVPGELPQLSPFPICLTTVVATYNERLNLIGEVYTGPHATGDLRYRSNSTSELGVGYSVSGAYGSWSQSGTESHTSGFEVAFPTQGINKRTVFQSYFGWHKLRQTCAGQSVYYLRQFEFQGGTASYQAAATPTATYCTSYLAGSTALKDTGTATTFSNGAKLGSVAGIDLSTKTGWNSQTSILFTFQANGKLCGTNGYPPQAGRVVAK
jgi:hypothetical protein